MSAPHTPGPWVFRRDIGNPIVETATLEDADGICLNGGFIVGRFTGTDARANAILAAAAPDLLAACQAVLDEFPAMDGRRIESVKAICRAAIRKATGAA